MPGGDSIESMEERGTSIPKGLGGSVAIVKENHGVQRHSRRVGESR
jgi:hypothetical protein